MEIIVFILCSIIGSFINVVAYSFPRKLDFLYRRSYCDYCLHTLSFIDMIPIFSYILLKGECRYCHKQINRRYTIIELLCGCIGVLFYQSYEPIHFFVLFIFLMMIILISLIDLDTMYVYDEFIILLFVVSLFLYPYFKITFTERVIGMLSLSLPMFLFNLYKEAFGGGDIKVFSVLGLLFGVQSVLCIFVYASLAASIYSFVLMYKKKLYLNSFIPFVPFICFGVFCFIVFGNIFIK